MRVFLLLGVLLLAGCSGPATTPPVEDEAPEPVVGDPFANGELDSALSSFDMGNRVIQGAAGPYLLHIRGETTVPSGDGPFPLLIVMHGRHGTCTTPAGERLLQPCPETPATASVRSYTGYRYLAEHLASHGIATISVDANNVNDHDNDYGLAGDDYGATARGNVILELVSELNLGTEFDDVKGKMNLAMIGLMGHSRGGEGVIRAATLAPQEFDAVFALAPTDFERWEMPAVPFGTILPYCDGDVSNLQGAWAYDDMNHGPKHQFLHMGTNHNYYNTIWTGSDWSNRGDPYCDEDAETSGRLSADEQRAEGMAIMGAFFRYYLSDGQDLWPLLEGTFPFAIDAKISSDLNRGFPMLENNGGLVFEIGGSAKDKVTPCTYTGCPIPETYSPTPQLHLALAAGDEIWWSLVGAPWTLGDDQFWSLRVGLSQEAEVAALDGLSMFAVDANGTRFEWQLADYGLFIPPGDAAAKTVLNMIVLPFADTTGIDRDNINRWGFHANNDVELQFADWYERETFAGGPRAIAQGQSR